MVRIGLIGCGSVARYGHLPAIQSVPGFELTAVCDLDAEQAQTTACEFDVPHSFTDPHAFFESDLFDAVAITSAAPAHRQNVLDAARFGKAVLCEKPLALTEADAEEMIVAMEAAGLPLFTAFCYRFSPSALQIKELVQTRAIGDVRSLRMIYDWNMHGRDETLTDGSVVRRQRRSGRMEEGGPMLDCGTHQIDLACWWLGANVDHVFGAGAWVEDWVAPDHLYLHMEHASGAHTTVEISYSYGATVVEPVSEFRYDLIGTEGVIRYIREASLFEIRTRQGTQALLFYPEKNFEGLYAAYAEALVTGNPGHLPSGRDGLLATRLARTATDQAIALRKAK